MPPLCPVLVLCTIRITKCDRVWFTPIGLCCCRVLTAWPWTALSYFSRPKHNIDGVESYICEFKYGCVGDQQAVQACLCMRTAPLWVITQPIVVISYGRFGNLWIRNSQYSCIITKQSAVLICFAAEAWNNVCFCMFGFFQVPCRLHAGSFQTAY